MCYAFHGIKASLLFSELLLLPVNSNTSALWGSRNFCFWFWNCSARCFVLLEENSVWTLNRRFIFEVCIMEVILRLIPSVQANLINVRLLVIQNLVKHLFLLIQYYRYIFIWMNIKNFIYGWSGIYHCFYLIISRTFSISSVSLIFPTLLS